MKKLFLFVFIIAIIFSCSLADMSEVVIPISEENITTDNGRYEFMSVPWGCSPEEFEALAGITLGEVDETDYPDLGFTRYVYRSPAARVTILGLETTRMSVEFRNHALWCVDCGITSDEGVVLEYEELVNKLTVLLGEPDHVVSRTASSNPMGMQSELRRWVGEYEEGLISTVALQMMGKDDTFTSLTIGWMLADPELIVTN